MPPELLPTVTLALAVQLVISLTVTLKLPPLRLVITEVVAPLLQSYDGLVPLLTVTVAVPLLWLQLAAVEVIFKTRPLLAAMLTLAIDSQPLLSSTVMPNVPEARFEIDEVEPPLLQLYV